MSRLIWCVVEPQKAALRQPCRRPVTDRDRGPDTGPALTDALTLALNLTAAHLPQAFGRFVCLAAGMDADTLFADVRAQVQVRSWRALRRHLPVGINVCS